MASRILEVLRRLALRVRARPEGSPDYANARSPMTLREGLAEYYGEHVALLAPADVSERIRDSLLAHDAAHVVFGCDTSTRGEVLLARWSLFGAKDAIPIYVRGLRARETRFLFADFVRGLDLLALPMIAISAARAVFRSLFMRTRWPSYQWQLYLDRPLCEIREEFGIQVI